MAILTAAENTHSVGPTREAAIGAKFDQAGEFHDGLALVKLGGAWNWITKDDKDMFRSS